MKICIYGAGAIGGLLGAQLSQAGEDVTLIARGPHLQAMQTNGLKLRIDGKELVARPRATSDPAEAGPQDIVIVTLKAHSVHAAAPAMRPLMNAQTAVVTAMNGVPWWFFDRLKGGKGPLQSLDPGGKIARAIPTDRVVGCVVHLAASTPEPGLISHNMGRKLIIGEPGGRNTARTTELTTALKQAGFEVVVSDFIEKDFWVKLLGNVSFNPVSALTGSTADRLIEDRQVKAYMVEIMREVLAIGRAVGVDAGIDPEARIDMARTLGNFKTSMLQDMEAGKPLEIDGLLAGTLEIAQKAGVRAPYTESLFGLIRARATTTGQYR